MPAILNESQLYEEYNRLSSFELCVQSQEIIQETFNKLTEFMNIMRVIATSTLHGDQMSYNQRKLKVEELLNLFDSIFQRLRIIGDLVHQRKLSLDSSHHMQQHSDQQLLVEQSNKELADLKEELKQKNAYVKLAIDKVSEIIWQINSCQKITQ